MASHLIQTTLHGLAKRPDGAVPVNRSGISAGHPDSSSLFYPHFKIIRHQSNKNGATKTK